MERRDAADEYRRSAASPAIERRDSGLNLVHRLNRWLVAGAVAAAGALSLIAAEAFHGRTVSHGASAGTGGGIQQPQAPSPSGAGAVGAPAPAPASSAPPVVVSGGS